MRFMSVQFSPSNRGIQLRYVLRTIQIVADCESPLEFRVCARTLPGSYTLGGSILDENTIMRTVPVELILFFHDSSNGFQL
jgi:hypothetical protein